MHRDTALGSPIDQPSHSEPMKRWLRAVWPEFADRPMPEWLEPAAAPSTGEAEPEGVVG